MKTPKPFSYLDLRGQPDSEHEKPGHLYSIVCAKGYNLDTRTIIAQKITQCWEGEITGESRANLKLKLRKKFTKILNPKNTTHNNNHSERWIHISCGKSASCENPVFASQSQ